MPRLGLRAQIMIALFSAFLLSFALLAFAAVRLTTRARSVDRLAAAEIAVRALAVTIDESERARDANAIDHLLETAIEPGVVTAVRVERNGRPNLVVGHDTTGPTLSARLTETSGRVTVWVDAAGDTSSAPLTNLLMLYAAFTSGAILLLTYVALTNLIVRPVESLTRASERLARGGGNVGVRVGGAAEVARLAASFNDMAAQLRTERASLEERLRELERTTGELRTAQEGLVRTEKLASVGRLAAGVAHEIGNPLSAILGFVELLRSGGLDEVESQEFLRRIHAETERIHKIIRDLLDFARQGGAEDTAASTDLREVVEDAVRLIAPQKDLRGVTIERRLSDTPKVRGASHRLSQVVLNLLLNAADAIKGDGAIRIEVAPIEGQQFASLVVSDTGPGISPDVVTTLFDPFVTTKPAGHGTGLGLAVSHTIVQALGGSIVASNPPGGGARFEVRLPFA